MLTSINLGAKVENNNSDNLGKVKLLVANPRDNQITHLIVERGLLETRQIVVDISWLVRVSDDGKTVWIDLTSEQMDAMPDFIEREYMANTNSNLAGVDGMVYPMVTNTMAEPLMSPRMPIVNQQPYMEHMNVPDNSMLIKQGAEVQASDGKLGRVKQVNLDNQTGAIASFIVEKGFFFTEDYEIPVAMVVSATENLVMLKMDKETVLHSLAQNPDHNREDQAVR